MKKGKVFRAIPAALALAFLLLAAPSCGSGEAKESTATTTKLPPGMSASDNAGTYEGVSTSGVGAAGNNGDASSSTGEKTTGGAGESAAGTSVTRTVALSGVEFTVVGARRHDNNKLVASSGTRTVSGDFLEVELRMKNVGDSLVSLPRFSFRLWNPFINAASYDDYYGNVTTYGGYVSTNIISADLLDYSTLQRVSVTLRMGEEIGDVFLFFDLNPLGVSRNEGFTKEGSNLVIYDTETGKKVEVNLAGFPD